MIKYNKQTLGINVGENNIYCPYTILSDFLNQDELYERTFILLQTKNNKTSKEYYVLPCGRMSI